MINGWVELHKFHLWCCSSFPTVFTEGMTYYEDLCKIKEILNGTITDINLTANELQKFEAQVNNQFEELRSGTWIEGTIPYLNMLLEKYIPVAIFFGLTESGYFTAYIPDTWDGITFSTTGYDTETALQPEYGHLILNY